MAPEGNDLGKRAPPARRNNASQHGMTQLSHPLSVYEPPPAAWRDPPLQTGTDPPAAAPPLYGPAAYGANQTPPRSPEAPLSVRQRRERIVHLPHRPLRPFRLRELPRPLAGRNPSNATRRRSPSPFTRSVESAVRNIGPLPAPLPDWTRNRSRIPGRQVNELSTTEADLPPWFDTFNPGIPSAAQQSGESPTTGRDLPLLLDIASSSDPFTGSSFDNIAIWSDEALDMFFASSDRAQHQQLTDIQPPVLSYSQPATVPPQPVAEANSAQPPERSCRAPSCRNPVLNPDQQLCDSCETQRTADNNQQQARIAAGTCRHCERPPQKGTQSCEYHTQQRRLRGLRYYDRHGSEILERQREQRRQRRLAGLCSSCSEPAQVGSSRCARHIEEQRRTRLRRKAKKDAAAQRGGAGQEDDDAGQGDVAE